MTMPYPEIYFRIRIFSSFKNLIKKKLHPVDGIIIKQFNIRRNITWLYGLFFH